MKELRGTKKSVVGKQLRGAPGLRPLGLKEDGDRIETPRRNLLKSMLSLSFLSFFLFFPLTPTPEPPQRRNFPKWKQISQNSTAESAASFRPHTSLSLSSLQLTATGAPIVVPRPKSYTMQPKETVSRSPLYKPLHLLSEDDISQLTREDCRRFLKEKGMRRPSWNKSQAIQQVISLKALLETTSESDASEAPKRLHIPRPQNPTRGPSISDVLVAVSADESAPTSGPSKPNVPDDTPVQFLAAENDSVFPRTADATNEPVGQMTIFYRGKVNVYDDVPDYKAQAIVQLAASPFFLLHEASSDVVTALWPFSLLPCHVQAAAANVGSDSPAVIFSRLQTGKVAERCQFPKEESSKSHEDNFDGLTSRQASVQRYLEKRKDRFKHKRKAAVPPSAGLDIHLNHRVGDQFLNQQFNLGEVCSPSHPRPPQTPTRSSSVENMIKNASLSTELNDRDNQEC